MDHQKEVKRQLVRMLTVRQAHMDFEDAVADFPEDHINSRPPNCDYSFWHLVEHMRIAQVDILEYILSDTYQAPSFPDGYWPDKSKGVDYKGWLESVRGFLKDRRELVEIVQDPKIDIYAPLPNSGEHQHNILREINIIANHNAYHTGELGILRQAMGLWSSKRKGALGE